MDNKNKMIYEIYINNKQFTCLYEKIEKEKNIPNILGIQDLILKDKKDNIESIKLLYQLNDLIKIKIYLNDVFILEQKFPLSIQLNRLRELLSQKINSYFNFSFNEKIIRINEESTFYLNNILKNNQINLYNKEFMFEEENIFDKDKINTNSEKINEKENIQEINNSGNKICEKQNNEIKLEENLDKKSNIKNEIDESLKGKNEEKEYKLFNENANIAEIKICPDSALNELREKYINLIPRRSAFLMKNKKIPISDEDKIPIKNIAEGNKIKLDVPKEDRSETSELEIFLNGKSYLKKEFYLHIKLKSLRINLKFDKAYKFIFRDKILSFDDENTMTLDELCYKELKVYFTRTKGGEIEEINMQKNYVNENRDLEEKISKNIFKTNENFDTWLIIGKQKSGKTTFINCLFNYIIGIKFEDNYRYSIEEQKRNDYGIYDIKGNSQKIRLIEFPGFCGEPDDDNKINTNIKKLIKDLKNVKLICFVISGNETRLTDELKFIFSNVSKIFAIDIISNFAFIITNCDAKKPPVLDCIKESQLSFLLNEPNNKMIFRFNNSYLYEKNQKDFWDIGISNFECFISEANKKENISLNITKQFIDFNFDKYSNNFLNSLLKQLNYQIYFDILNNINSYDYNNEIPFDYYEIDKICSNCNRKITQTPCKYCGKENKHKRNKISLFALKKDNKLYNSCLNKYKMLVKDQLINSAILYQSMKEFYNYRLIPNSSLENDLNNLIPKNDKNRKLYVDEIKKQDILYNDYLKGNFKYNYKDYLKNFVEINK